MMPCATPIFFFKASTCWRCVPALYLFILFPYIPFRYIPWKWKTSHSVYIIRQLAHGI